MVLHNIPQRDHLIIYSTDYIKKYHQKWEAKSPLLKIENFVGVMGKCSAGLNVLSYVHDMFLKPYIPHSTTEIFPASPAYLHISYIKNDKRQKENRAQSNDISSA